MLRAEAVQQEIVNNACLPGGEAVSDGAFHMVDGGGFEEIAKFPQGGDPVCFQNLLQPRVGAGP